MTEEKVFSGGAWILSCSLCERAKQQEARQGGRTGQDHCALSFVNKIEVDRQTDVLCYLIEKISNITLLLGGMAARGRLRCSTFGSAATCI